MPEPRQPIGVIARYLGGYYFGGLLTGIQQAARKAGVPLIVIDQDLGDLQSLYSAQTPSRGGSSSTHSSTTGPTLPRCARPANRW